MKKPQAAALVLLVIVVVVVTGCSNSPTGVAKKFMNAWTSIGKESRPYEDSPYDTLVKMSGAKSVMADNLISDCVQWGPNMVRHRNPDNFTYELVREGSREAVVKVDIGSGDVIYLVVEPNFMSYEDTVKDISCSLPE